MNAHDAPEAPDVQVEVVRVFTDAAGGLGNALGIARAGDVVALDKQELAARLGFSETTVVEDPVDGVARVRIYTPAVELPFAGHPSVGTAWWLAAQRMPVHTLQVPAGPVAVEQTDGITWITARAEWAPEFAFHQLETAEELALLRPDDFSEGQHYFWTWTDETRGALRSRMFAPAMGIAEDEATGAAAVALTGQLRRGLVVTQGQGSQLYTEWDSDGWVRLGGRVAEDHTVVL
ncbi:PhzF family phenazine biosynthesis protein [Nocardia neocaledoniensis]|uniref:PhzF family phenazine biosynthesis protein n=1 Tax=Nocardia neocaledoniensis TaxID=236511 RepID=UPI002457171B|nr:PhzF family phenazine biosynthesis protein [Nocardia neocaledoniensis]